ncbi:MAG TPA: AI-2E family transporter, partial [Desulfobacterales bacterium]|nr:AI-2E family transporter [Desulfobacterales bacterium]
MKNIATSDMILRFFLALFIVSFIMLGWLIWPFISIIILATVVTGIFNPVFNSFKNKINVSAASLLTCMIIFIILFIPIVFFVGILSKEAYDLYLTAKNAVLSDQIKNLFESSRVLEKINQIL